MGPLREAYVRERPDAADDATLEERLAGLVRAARSRWPSVRIVDEELAAAVAALPGSAHALEADAVAELALALACARGDAAAFTLFELEYFRGAEAVLAGMKLDADTRDEVRQEIRRKLLVADGGPPKIVGYAGRGTLHGLVKVVATRTAISLLRKRGVESPGDDALLDAEGEADPELSFLQARYRPLFRAAFEEAVGALGPRERNLLRLHFLRNVTLDALAAMYGVHRATIVRQLAKIRDELDRATRNGLREKLGGADAREIDGVMDLVRSRFDVSVERLLRTMEGQG